MKIIGAGLSGLICGALNPGSTIYERQQELPNNHGAVLRFRSDKIGKALGIPFKPVRVTKAIWFDGQEVQPHPRFQNMYSRKVTGEYGRRSIANIDPCTRYIAPDDFIQQLADRNSIVFNCEYPNNKHFPGDGEPTISTMPLPTLMDLLLPGAPFGHMFHRESIWARTLTFDSSIDIYQTIYFPKPIHPLYRASFTGNKLILEYNDSPTSLDGMIFWREAFGFDDQDYVADSGIKHQLYGKIVPIDNSYRQSVIGELSHEYDVYSLGRFATWRNILLDDVFDDIFKIRDLMSMDHYSRRLNQ